MDRFKSQVDNLSFYLGKYRDDLIVLYNILNSDKIMAFAKARQIAECIVSDILKDNKQSGTFDKNIELCQKKGLIPTEISTIFHYIWVMGNKQHAGSLRIEISERDIDNLLNNILRIYDWYFCEYENGLKLGSIVCKSKNSR